MPSTTQVAVQDATSYASDPKKALKPTAKFLSISAGSSPRRGFIYFPRDWPLGAQAPSSHLLLRQYKAAASASRTITVQLVTSKWDEGTLTHSNQPGVSGPTATITRSGAGVAGELWDFDVTALIALITAGQPWYGFRVVSNSSSVLMFNSREAGALAPKLVVDYAVEPSKPSVLTPTNGRAVSVLRPWLTFDYTDFTPNAEMAAYRILFNNADAWGSPAVDTGWVSSSVPIHQLGFDANTWATTYWRVMVRNAAGQESDWSDTASFTYSVKGTVGITNPAAAPNNFVTEPTPPFSHTFSGIQVRRQYLVTAVDDLSQVFWDSGITTTTDLSLAPPSDLPLQVGQEYEFHARVWDDQLRADTPGDPSYAVASRVFTFNLSNTVAPVNSIVALAQPEPWWLIEFDDSTAADLYALVDNGVMVGTFLPDELFVSGTTYQLMVRHVTPLVGHTYRIDRIVNGVTSSGSPETDEMVLKVRGAWIATEDGGHVLYLGGTDPIRWDADEQVTLHRPLGASNPSIVTGGVLGRAGRCDAPARPYGTQTLAEVATTWAELTDQRLFPRGTPMVLTLADTCTRFFWWETVRDHKSDFVDKFGVRFELHELV